MRLRIMFFNGCIHPYNCYKFMQVFSFHINDFSDSKQVDVALDFNEQVLL